MPGSAASAACLRLAVAVAPLEVPRLGEVGIDGAALALAGGAAVVSAIGCGLPPAWRASRIAPAAALKAAARTGTDGSGQRLGDLLVGAQVTLTVVLLVAGGLLLSSFLRVVGVDRGCARRTGDSAAGESPAGRRR